MLAERNRTQADIDREASEWLARWRLSRLTADDAALFETWRRADPRNAQAFASMNRALDDVASLRSLAEVEPAELRNASWRARAWGMGAGAAAAAAAVLFWAPAVLNAPDIEASTLVAEIRPITLADGTRVTLGARSEIKVDFDGRQRLVRLTRGEAFFEVAEDSARPFVVEASGAEIRDIGTSFEVKRVDGGVEVGVLDGIVEVQPRSLLGRRPVARLVAGQRIKAHETSVGPIVATATVGPVERASAEPGAWRDGQLTYHDTSLAEVIDDLNRYYPAGVRLEADTIADLRLAASFKAEEIDKFLAELPSVAPVLVSRDGDGAIVITRRASGDPEA